MKRKNKPKKSTRKNAGVSKNQHNRLLSRTKDLERLTAHIELFLHCNLRDYKDSIEDLNERLWKLEARFCHLRDRVDENKPKDTQDK